MCRWPNGDLSFVSAPNMEDAIVMLDEWDNAELAELRRAQDFMVDFSLTDDGELELQAFGESVLNDIWERAYPLLSQARLDTSDEKTIGNAVRAEKERLVGKRKPKLADTEMGKTLQSQMGSSAALANRQVKRAASDLLKKLPGSGRKH